MRKRTLSLSLLILIIAVASIGIVYALNNLVKQYTLELEVQEPLEITQILPANTGKQTIWPSQIIRYEWVVQNRAPISYSIRYELQSVEPSERPMWVWVKGTIERQLEGNSEYLSFEENATVNIGPDEIHVIEVEIALSSSAPAGAFRVDLKISREGGFG